MRSVKSSGLVAAAVLGAMLAGCGKKPPPVVAAAPTPSAVSAPTAPPTAPRPVQRVEEAVPVAQETIVEESIGGRSLDDLNRESPLKPALFDYDSAELDGDAQKIVQANAGVLKTFATWVVTLEGHCDERGTAEYNLALGERRAAAVKTYLVSLGISPDRLRIVSYGKEFPFDAAHTEGAWSKNRRAHFVITAK